MRKKTEEGELGIYSTDKISVLFISSSSTSNLKWGDKKYSKTIIYRKIVSSSSRQKNLYLIF